MADLVDVDPAVLGEISTSFDDRSREVDEVVVPEGVDAGVASADVLLMLAELSSDLGEIAGGIAAMAVQVDATRQLYLDADAEAAEAFTSRTSDLIAPVDQFETYLHHAAGGLDYLAGELEQSQRSMEAIRSDAAGAGLSVRGHVIEHPGPPLPYPSPRPVDADTHAAAAHAPSWTDPGTRR